MDHMESFSHAQTFLNVGLQRPILNIQVSDAQSVKSMNYINSELKEVEYSLDVLVRNVIIWQLPKDAEVMPGLEKYVESENKNK